jgi:tight adherence protein B
MTPLAWLAIAAAVVLADGASPSSVRIASLVAAGRLAPAPTGGAAKLRPAVASVRAAGTRWAGAAAVIATGVGGFAVAGPAVAIAFAAISVTASVLGRDVARGRTLAGRRRELLGALRVLISELEAGSRPAVALTAAREIAPSYATPFGRAASAAAGANEAGTILAAEPDTRAIGLAWRLSEETGVALTGVLTRVAADLGEADEQRRAVTIALAGPRASAALLTGLPLLGIGLGTAMGTRPWEFLFGAPAGRIVCCVGVLLDVAGVFWIRRILRRAQRQ